MFSFCFGGEPGENRLKGSLPDAKRSDARTRAANEQAAFLKLFSKDSALLEGIKQTRSTGLKNVLKSYTYLFRTTPS